MYRVSHILVRHRHEAEDVIRKLKEGRDFGEVARAFSICASAERGGDLGLLARGRAHPEFEEAALRLDEGRFSDEPLRTPFGYHVLKKPSK